MATIADVARAAGVGVGTVSRVLNESTLVSAETRRRVLDVIEELDYTPSPVARRLSLGRTHTIAVVLPFITSPSAVERLRGVVAGLRGSTYDFVVYDVEAAEHQLEQFRTVAGTGRADGVLVVSLPPPAAEIERLRRSSVPVVLIDAKYDGLPHVGIDDVEGGAIAARHLLELGHRRIGFVGDPPDNPFGFTSGADRERGFRRPLAEAGVELDARHGPHGHRVAQQLARELLTSPAPPTAIFAASDLQALGVLEAAAELGVDVPGQLSVLGFDDVDISSYVGLSTIRQPLFESGRRGAELLLAALVGGAGAAPISETLALELVARRTTARPSDEQRWE